MIVVPDDLFIFGGSWLKVNHDDWTPHALFMTRGQGSHREKLASFELALRDASIECYNLVPVSSILPPRCELLERSAGLEQLQPGQVVPVVLARCQSAVPGEQPGAAVGVAVPRDREHYGYLSEHHVLGMGAQMLEDYVEDLAAEMLATTYGLEFDPEASWDEKRELWSIDNRIVRTRSVVETATVGPERGWTTVVAAAVLVL